LTAAAAGRVDYHRAVGADATESTQQPGAARRPGLPEFGRGTCVGRYVVIDALGAGGMGVVYRAYDPELDRRVALKLVRELSEQATARLIAEAQALARVSHPNIVAVHDVGRFAGSVFIAMELVEGRTLQAWYRGQARPWRETLAALLAAGRGLAAAHAAGLIHRDFKPSNVIVGDDGRVRVLDFGLARVATLTTSSTTTGETRELSGDQPAVAGARGGATGGGDGGDGDEVTATAEGVATSSTAVEIPPDEALARRALMVDHDGSTIDDDAALPQILASRVIGTPVYMAPEQRKRGVIDARADQFSFAVAAWELLYGERPFEGTDAASYAASAAAGRLRTPPPKSDVPAWVRRALTRALAPAPADRFRTMDELLAALSADPASRRRTLAIAGVATGLVVLAAIGLARRPAEAPRCQGGRAQLAGVWDGAARARLEAAFVATGRPYAADAHARVAARLDARGDAWVAMHRDACLANDRGEQSDALLDLRMACLERRRGELAAMIGELTEGVDAERVSRALDAVSALPDVATCADREALTAAVPLPADPQRRARIAEVQRDVDAALALHATGQYVRSRDRGGAALSAARALDHAPLLAEAARTVGLAAIALDEHGAAEAALHEAVAQAARAHLDAYAARAWADLVRLVGFDQARTAEGLAYAVAAAAAIARAGGDDEAETELLLAEALTLLQAGRSDEALGRARRALALRERVAAPGASGAPTVSDDGELADALTTVAMIASSRGDYDEAATLHARALALREAQFGPEHPRVGDSLDNLGVVRFHQGALDEALALYERALAVRVAALGEHHRDVGTSHNNLGGLYLDRGDDARARTHLEAALAAYERALGPAHPDLAIPLTNLGELAARGGDHARALGYCERALALDEAASTPDDPELAYDLQCIGEAQLGVGAAAAARPVLERALALRERAPGDPGELARTRLAAARALGATARTPAERARARALALAARDGFAALGDAWAARKREAEAWLAR
jgi:serine/threonine protein kinase/Tfp pilus assembly protein PilF